MGLLTRLRANLRLVRELYGRQRARGHGRLHTILWRLPQAVALRGYRKLAYAINDGVLQRWVTPSRFRRFQDRLPGSLGGHFYLIVMPNTLHYLLPCLRLVAKELRVILLINGARAWEADMLRLHWPELPQFRVATLPNSSVGHGAMINLLLRNNKRDFGLMDHDLYIFDMAVLKRLEFADPEFLLCLLSDRSTNGKWTYPLTHFLYFRLEIFKHLMERYGVGAQSYRHVPKAAQSQLRALGLREGETMKDYHNFFDTLHILLALGYADGLGIKQIQPAEMEAFYHVGGTSIGTFHTKDLAQLYTHLRFLEFAAEPLLQRRYASVAAPFTSASELRKLLPGTAQIIQQLQVTDRLMDRLRQALAQNN